MVMLLIDTGMRRGELAGLMVEDIDLERGRVAIRAETSKTRTGHSVAMGYSASRALSKYLRARASHRDADAPAQDDRGRTVIDERNRKPVHPLWLGLAGPMTVSGVAQAIKERGKLAGLGANVRPHLFRHTYAHRWQLEEGNESDLMTQMGWKSGAMLRRYGAGAGGASRGNAPSPRAGRSLEVIRLRRSSDGERATERSAVNLGLTIRDARITDAPALARVYIDSAEHHVALDPAMYTVPDESDVLTKTEEQLRTPATDAHVVVADLSGDVVGSADVRIIRTTDTASMIRPQAVASIGVAVLAKYRGRGIGEWLMRRAEEWAMAHGADAAVLDMSAANTEARRFYTDRFGYTVTGLFLRKPLDRDSK